MRASQCFWVPVLFSGLAPHVPIWWFTGGSQNVDTHSGANGANSAIGTGLSSGSLGSSWAGGSTGSNLSLSKARKKNKKKRGFINTCNTMTEAASAR